MSDDERCGGTGMVSYWDGGGYAGECCRGCIDCEPPYEPCGVDEFAAEYQQNRPAAVAIYQALSAQYLEVIRERDQLLVALKVCAETLGDVGVGLDARVEMAYNMAHGAIAKAEAK